MHKTIILNPDCVEKVLTQFGYCLRKLSGNGKNGLLKFETIPPNTYQLLSFSLNSDGLCIYNSTMHFTLTNKFPNDINQVNEKLQKCA